jgi:hypothetical protein
MACKGLRGASEGYSIGPWERAIQTDLGVCLSVTLPWH